MATSKESVKYNIALLMDSSSLILIFSFYKVTNTVCKNILPLVINLLQVKTAL